MKRTWMPHGKDSSTRIEADTNGTANVSTIGITCNFESTPDDVMIFCKSIQRAIIWVEKAKKPKHDKSAWDNAGEKP